MRNKGFSIMECVLCMFLLSSVTVGIVSIVLNIATSNNDHMYKVALFSNYHTIYNICDLSDNPKDKLIEVYQDKLTVVNEDKYRVEIELEKKYKSFETLVFEVTFEEDEYNLFVNVKALNVDKNYEEINHEVFSKRVYPK